MKNSFVKIILLALLLAVGGTAFAEALRCRVCNREARGRFIKAGDAVFCSKLCYEKTLPRCANCGRVLRGAYVTAGDQKFCGRECYGASLPRCDGCGARIEGSHQILDGKHYCGKSCLERQLPKCELCQAPLYKQFSLGSHLFCGECVNLPHCWRCQLPHDEGVRLPDSRQLCKRCAGDMIATPEQAQTPYAIARHEVFRVTSFKSATLPTLRLVGEDILKKYVVPGQGTTVVQRGVYCREVTVVTSHGLFGKTKREVSDVKEDIFILSGLSRRDFIVTAAHELTHDLLAEQFPGIAEKAPEWVEEGLCQYVAAAACLLNGYYDELKAIETAPDRDYGDGYRFFKNMLGDANWKGAVLWMNRADIGKLPQFPPAR